MTAAGCESGWQEECLDLLLIGRLPNHTSVTRYFHLWHWATFTLIMNKVCQQWIQKTKFWVYQQFCPLLFWIILITIHIPIKSASNWTENDWVVHQDPDHRLKVSTFPVNPSTFNLLPENLPRISSPTCDITQISLEMFLSTPSLSQPPGQCTKSIVHVQIGLYLNLESSFRVASRSSEAVDKPFIPC